MGGSEEQPKREGAVQHLEEALEADNTEDKNYHLKEALQLLDLDAYSDEDR